MPSIGAQWASLVAHVVKNVSTRQETQVRSLNQEGPGEVSATHFMLWPGELHGQRSLVGYNSWGRKY